VQDPSPVELAQGFDDSPVERTTSGPEKLSGVEPVRPTMGADVGDLLPRQTVLLREGRPLSGGLRHVVFSSTHIGRQPLAAETLAEGGEVSPNDVSLRRVEGAPTADGEATRTGRNSGCATVATA